MVTGESVSVNFFIKIRETDQISEEISIKIPPTFSEMSGLKTIIAPKKPTKRARILCFLSFSLKNTNANNVVKMGTVKLRAVTSDNVVNVKP